MSNWVSGHIAPTGESTKVDEFVKYIKETEPWCRIINNEYKEDDIENDIGLRDNSALSAIMLTEILEDKFPDVNFTFFISDEMNGYGWKVEYEDGFETRTLYDEDTSSYKHFKIIEKNTNKLTEEFINNRRTERENEKEKYNMQYIKE